MFKSNDAAKTAAQRLLEAAPSLMVTMMEQMEFTVPERVAQFAAALRQARFTGLTSVEALREAHRRSLGHRDRSRDPAGVRSTEGAKCRTTSR